MKNKNHSQKNTLLQVAQANAETKTCKRVFFSPAQEKLKNKKFSSLKKNKTLQTHSQQADTNFHGGQLTTQHLRTFHGDTDDSSTGGNSGFKKAGVLYSVDSFVGYQSSVFQMKFGGEIPRLLKPAKRYRQC